MFKVFLCGTVSSDPEIKEIGESKVCNFTLACKNNFDKYDSHVRCSIWGSFVEEFEKDDFKNKRLFIEGEGTNKLLDKKDGNRQYVFNVKCSKIEVLE